MRHDWTAFPDGPQGQPYLLAVTTLETGEPASNASPEELAREVLRLAEENADLKAIRARIETVTSRDSYRDMTLAEMHGIVVGLARENFEARRAELVAAERARIRQAMHAWADSQDWLVGEEEDAFYAALDSMEGR